MALGGSLQKGIGIGIGPGGGEFNPTPFFEILAENGDFLIAENGAFLILEGA